MLVDVCLYAGEVTMLELRMRTLAPVVDAFVAVVCTTTHQGEPADVARIDVPDYAGRPRLAIHYAEPPGHVLAPFRKGDGYRGGVHTPAYQSIERFHRNAATDALTGLAADPGDLIMVSDVDEIPDPHVIADRLRLLDRMTGTCKWLVCAQTFFSTAIDVLHPQQPWLGTMISRLRDLEPQAMRDARGELWDAGCVIADAGWHFSWLGTDEERQRKLDTFSHAELRGWDPKEGRRTLTHINGEPLHKLTLTELEHMTYPRPIRDAEFSIPRWFWADA